MKIAVFKYKFWIDKVHEPYILSILPFNLYFKHILLWK
jgi:hypothetical protein